MIEATYTFAHLTDTDWRALVRALGPALPDIPAGTPFATHCERCGYGPERCWSELSHTTDVRVMIACAALRGRVTRLPPDPQLNPTPYPRQSPANGPPASADGHPDNSMSAPDNTRPRTKIRSTSQTGKPPWRDDRAVVTHVTPNPKKPGSATYERYKGYRVGMTVAEVLATGITRGDVNWDGQRRLVIFELPPEEGA